MIRTEREYRETKRRLRACARRLAEERAAFRSMGCDVKAVKRGLDPLRSFRNGLVAETIRYERLKTGRLPALRSLAELGCFLVEARIAAGMTQRALAKRLSRPETRVSRDEGNDYYGVTVAEAARVLEALGVTLRLRVVRRVGRRTDRPSSVPLLPPNRHTRQSSRST